MEKSNTKDRTANMGQPNSATKHTPSKEIRNIRIGYLCWQTEEPLEPSNGHLLRGFILSLFPDYDILHNHAEDGKDMYRYPKIQYKIIHGMPMIVGIGEEAIPMIQKISMSVHHLVLGRRKIAVEEPTLEIQKSKFGISPIPKKYAFLTPCILLNAENYAKYSKSEKEEQAEILTRALIGNLLSASKGMDYTVPDRLQASYNLNPEPVCLKGQSMIGFKGFFTTNFYLPNFLGIGKCPSRGYGVCMEVD